MSLVPNYNSSDYSGSSDEETELFQTIKPTNTKEKLKILLPKIGSDSDSDNDQDSEAQSNKQSKQGNTLQDILPDITNKEQTEEKESEENNEPKQPSLKLSNSTFIPHKLAKTKAKNQSKNMNNDLLNLFPMGKDSINAYSNAKPKSAVPVHITNKQVKSETNHLPSHTIPQPAQEPIPAATSARDEELEKFIYGRKKRGLEDNVQIHDINVTDNLSNPETQITDVATQSNFSKISTVLPPSTNMKRRHNIMYLAQQAKARENELLESYAQNRKTKKETRSKYGF